jgi:hypothetical protein
MLYGVAAPRAETIRPANLMGVTPQGVTTNGGGSARVYSNPLVEENGKIVKGRIESRGS